MHRRNSGRAEHIYRQRFLGSMVGVLILTIVLIRMWPNPTPSEADGPFADRSSDRIQLEDIQPTHQPREQNPPPPAPLPPVVVPNDVIVEETYEVGDATLQIENPDEDPEYQEGRTAAATSARQPDTGARLLRNVQPRYPSAAHDDGVRARVQIAVKVAKNGRVQDATILKRWRISESGRARPVADLGYGLDEAALKAARRSLFRPARHRGKPVATRVTITFSFGDE